MGSAAKLALFLTLAVVACALSTEVGAGGQSGLNKSKTQTDKPDVQRDSKDGAIKLNATVINVAAVVTDRSGRYVAQLTKDDFQVFEDGAEQQIAFFGNDEVPFNVALLMDVSQSVSDSLKDIKKAATEFVHQLRPNDLVMVACFDERVRYLTDFTSDRKTLETAINGCQTGHGTSVYDAVYDTVTARFRGIEGRKALLLLSDGEDTTSSELPTIKLSIESRSRTCWSMDCDTPIRAATADGAIGATGHFQAADGRWLPRVRHQLTRRANIQRAANTRKAANTRASTLKAVSIPAGVDSEVRTAAVGKTAGAIS